MKIYINGELEGTAAFRDRPGDSSRGFGIGSIIKVKASCLAALQSKASTNSLGMKMMPVKPGSFIMGENKGIYGYNEFI